MDSLAATIARELRIFATTFRRFSENVESLDPVKRSSVEERAGGILAQAWDEGFLTDHFPELGPHVDYHFHGVDCDKGPHNGGARLVACGVNLLYEFVGRHQIVGKAFKSESGVTFDVDAEEGHVGGILPSQYPQLLSRPFADANLRKNRAASEFEIRAEQNQNTATALDFVADLIEKSPVSEVRTVVTPNSAAVRLATELRESLHALTCHASDVVRHHNGFDPAVFTPERIDEAREGYREQFLRATKAVSELRRFDLIPEKMLDEMSRAFGKIKPNSEYVHRLPECGDLFVEWGELLLSRASNATEMQDSQATNASGEIQRQLDERRNAEEAAVANRNAAEQLARRRQSAKCRGMKLFKWDFPTDGFDNDPELNGLRVIELARLLRLLFGQNGIVEKLTVTVNDDSDDVFERRLAEILIEAMQSNPQATDITATLAELEAPGEWIASQRWRKSLESLLRDEYLEFTKLIDTGEYDDVLDALIATSDPYVTAGSDSEPAAAQPSLDVGDNPATQDKGRRDAATNPVEPPAYKAGKNWIRQADLDKALNLGSNSLLTAKTKGHKSPCGQWGVARGKRPWRKLTNGAVYYHVPSLPKEECTIVREWQKSQSSDI